MVPEIGDGFHLLVSGQITIIPTPEWSVHFGGDSLVPNHMFGCDICGLVAMKFAQRYNIIELLCLYRVELISMSNTFSLTKMMQETPPHWNLSQGHVFFQTKCLAASNVRLKYIQRSLNRLVFKSQIENNNKNFFPQKQGVNKNNKQKILVGSNKKYKNKNCWIKHQKNCTSKLFPKKTKLFWSSFWLSKPTKSLPIAGCASTNFLTAGTVPWMELNVVHPLMATTMGIQNRNTAKRAKRPYNGKGVVKKDRNKVLNIKNGIRKIIDDVTCIIYK